MPETRLETVGVPNIPIETISYRTASYNGLKECVLPIISGRVTGLPEEIEALVVTADLQGRVDDGCPLGAALAAELAILSEAGRIPRGDRSAVLLCGDFYSEPDLAQRGTSGDARETWEAMASWARWVVGVPGNHDTFSAEGGEHVDQAFASQPNMFLLMGSIVEVGGLRVAGIGGVVGTKNKPWRRHRSVWTADVERLLASDPHVLLLHEGPGETTRAQHGITDAWEIFERHQAQPLICRGHVPWELPVLQRPSGLTVLNAHEHAFVLTRS